MCNNCRTYHGRNVRADKVQIPSYITPQPRQALFFSHACSQQTEDDDPGLQGGERSAGPLTLSGACLQFQVTRPGVPGTNMSYSVQLLYPFPHPFTAGVRPADRTEGRCTGASYYFSKVEIRSEPSSETQAASARNAEGKLQRRAV